MIGTTTTLLYGSIAHPFANGCMNMRANDRARPGLPHRDAFARYLLTGQERVS